MLLSVILCGFLSYTMSSESRAEDAVRKMEKDSVSGVTTQTAAAHPAIQTNLISDGNFDKIGTAWTVQKPTEPCKVEVRQVQESLPNGRKVSALRLTTDGNIQIFSNLIKIDHNKSYRFSLWIKNDITSAGSRWFGPHAFKDDGSYLQVFKPDGQCEENPYFWLGNMYQDGGWHKFVGYLISTNCGDNWTAPKDASKSNFRFPYEAGKVRMRFLSAYNNGTLVKTCFALPVIEEVDFEELVNN